MKFYHNISILFLFIFLILPSSSLTQENPIEIELNTVKDSFHPKENSISYYYLKIPKDIEHNTNNLVISVTQNQKITEFSDPDIYVSKTEINPTSSSTWSSESYGDDILSIGSSFVFSGEKFYIAVYCQYKCQFSLKTTLSKQLEIFPGKIYTYSIPKESSITLKFKTQSNDYDELQMRFMSLEFQPFKVYVSKEENPVGTSTMSLNPSLLTGYWLSIPKDSEYYCTDCYYYIILTSTTGYVTVDLYATYPDIELLIRTTDPVLDNIDSHRVHCYKLEPKAINDQCLILTIILFSGSALLQFNGYESVNSRPFTDIPYDENTYDITSEKVITILPSEIEDMKKQASDNGISDFSYLHFCIYGIEKSSFMLRANYESQMEELQRYNFIIAGSTISGHLNVDSVTSYRILEFTDGGNVTVTMDVIDGMPRMYGYWGENPDEVFFNEIKLQNAIRDKEVIHPIETLGGYELTILNEYNKCHQKIGITDNLQDEIKKYSCSLFVIIKCSGGQNCIFRLRVITDESSQYLPPRTSLFNILPMDQIDSYHIYIEDQDIDSFTVVENNISGETELTVFRYYELNNDYIILDQKDRVGFIPNVIKVNKKLTQTETLVGEYKVFVKAKTFSTYSVYYYTENSNKASFPSIKDVKLQLETGKIINDYLGYNEAYKIYQFETDIQNAYHTDFRITLTRRNLPTDFYVFKSLNTFRYEPSAIEKVQGYQWKSDIKNQLVITQSDENYSLTGPYYIVVLKRMSYDSDLQRTFSFCLGVTDLETNFVLFENIQHSVFLEPTYPFQGYSYSHSDIRYDFNLAVNVFNGKINIYVDFNKIQINQLDNSIYVDKLWFNKKQAETNFITIKKQDLQKAFNIKGYKCNTNEPCSINLYILITVEKLESAQYIITGKRKKNAIEYLTPDVVKKYTIEEGERQYFLIEEASSDKIYSHIHVNFETGNADAYLTLYNNDYPDIRDFPTEKRYDYKGEESFFSGLLFAIPSKDLEDCIGCKILITVIGKKIGYINNTIYYSITYSKEIKFITQNSPFHNYIKSGEINYYRFNFGKETKNIFISIYEARTGLAMYLNYGTELPTFIQHHWHSNNPQHQFMNIDINDPIIVQNGRNSLEGVYTLLIYGYNDSPYTLYVSNHDKKIIPISNNFPGTCFGNATNICYFRYDLTVSDYDKIIIYNGKLSIIFVTTFTYGGGNMYATLYKKPEYKETTDFPNKSNYDYSNRDMNKRNFLKIEIDSTNKKLTNDSSLLISVICNGECLFDMTATRITFGSYHYLELVRENIFYLYAPKDENDTRSESYLSFYYYEKNTLNYEVYSYTGKAEIEVYQNQSKFDTSANKYIVNYQSIETFNISNKETHFNIIQPKEKHLYQNIYFKVKPQTDFGFYVKLNYDSKWTPIEPGEYKTFAISHGVFYGYFDMLEHYEDVVLSIRSSEKNQDLEVYVKINILNVPDLSNLTLLEIPDSKNFDYQGEKLPALSTVTVRIHQIPLSISKKKYVRALFVVNAPMGEVDEIEFTKLDILLSPQVNSFQVISAEPRQFAYAEMGNGGNESVVFDITKARKNDNFIRIYVSSCKGEFMTSITDEISYFKDSGRKVSYLPLIGKGIMKLDILNATSPNYYLNVWGKKDPLNQCNETINSNCSSRVEFMVYYTTFTSQVDWVSVENLVIYNIIGKGTIELNLYGINKLEKNNLDDYNYQVFISRNKTDYEHMESLCHLSRMTNDMEAKVIKSHNKTIEISNLQSKVSYFITVRLVDKQTGEMFILTPIQIYLSYNHFSLWLIIVISIVIVILLIAVIYYFRRYRKTLTALKIETGEITNEVPKSEAEMSVVNVNEPKSKYANLNEEN